LLFFFFFDPHALPFFFVDPLDITILALQPGRDGGGRIRFDIIGETQKNLE
jgi:hypothetical protein